MKLNYAETGTGNDETIVFIHAGGISGWMWDEQVKYFKNYHCIIPDLPEHGMNACVKPFTIENAAETVSELINNFADEKVNLVGIGVGGQIVLQILSTCQKMVDHALVSGTLVRNIQYKSLIRRINQLLKVYKPVKNNDFYIKAYMRTYNMPKIYFDNFKESTCQIGTSSIERVLIQNHLFKLPKIPQKTKTKLLVMAGEKDYKIIKEYSIKKILSIDQAEGALALGVGHLWNIESPINFNTVLEAWLQDDPLPESIISTL